jgi:hypothetical protein
MRPRRRQRRRRRSRMTMKNQQRRLRRLKQSLVLRSVLERTMKMSQTNRTKATMTEKESRSELAVQCILLLLSILLI